MEEELHVAKRGGWGKEERGAGESEVATPRRRDELELQVVGKPLEQISQIIVAEGEEDVWVVWVVDDKVGPSVVSYPVSEGKRRRVNYSSAEDGSKVGEGSVRGLVHLRLRGETLSGLRLEGLRGRGERDWGPRVLADLFMKRVYRFVDRELLGPHNGIVGDTFHTRRGGACVQGRGNFGGGVGGGGNRPYY